MGAICRARVCHTTDGNGGDHRNAPWEPSASGIRCVPELGGDSVFAGQILSEVTRTFGVHLGQSRAFEAFTAKGLPEMVDEALLAQVERMDDAEVLAELHGGS